jgi:hypothetical protein
MNPHQYYPGVLITNHNPNEIKVKKFFDPKVGLWKIIIKSSAIKFHGGKQHGKENNNSKESSYSS